MSTSWKRTGCPRFLAVLAFLLWAAGGWPAALGQVASVSSTSIRPFVVAFIPVVGRNGAIGGVTVNAAGVLRSAEPADSASLREAWLRAREPLPEALGREVGMRMVSLRALDEALAAHLEDERPLPDEMLFVAGLKRVEYVFVMPDRRDLILAGPADGWELGGDGAMLASSSASPVLRLDDLMDALRSAEAAAATPGITCSIDPTERGLLQLKQLLSGRQPRLNQQTVEQMRHAVGEQQVTVTGVEADSHFARVMVAADYQMKLLAMGLEPAPLEGLPSYLDLLAASSRRGAEIAAPRWWLAADYEPLLRSADGLAWQLRGPGVQALTEDGYLGADGRLVDTDRSNPLAERWAAAFSERYEELGRALPVFAELRNLMDLAVLAALIAKEDLLSKAGCDLPLLTSAARVRGPRYNVPRSVDSQVSLTRGQRGWFVSISGGVEIDSWAQLRRVETSEKLAAVRSRAASGAAASWWWDE